MNTYTRNRNIYRKRERKPKRQKQKKKINQPNQTTKQPNKRNPSKKARQRQRQSTAKQVGYIEINERNKRRGQKRLQKGGFLFLLTLAMCSQMGGRQNWGRRKKAGKRKVWGREDQKPACYLLTTQCRLFCCSYARRTLVKNITEPNGGGWLSVD